MSEITKETSSRTGSVLVAFAAGALAGAVAAILLAPRSGRDTRERIGQTARSTKDLAARVPAAVRGAREAFSEAVHAGEARAKGDGKTIPLEASHA